MQKNDWLNEVAFDEKGLIPAIAQDHESGQVLMVAWMNKTALAMTVEKKQAVYFSRSRQTLWHKGETSGHFQEVHAVYMDCDADVICLKVTQRGNIACHTGRNSCFYKQLIDGEWKSVLPVLKDPKDIYETPKQTLATENKVKTPIETQADTLSALTAILEQRKQAKADDSYVASLYHKGLNKILEKIGEESTEVIIAAKDLQKAKVAGTEHQPISNEERSAYHEVVYEVADLWFHTMVMLVGFNIAPVEVLDELANRFGMSGLEEKASRSK